MDYSELVELLQGYLENEETTFVDNIPLYVRLCEEDIYRTVQLPQTKKVSGAMVIASGDGFVTLPEDYLSAYSFATITGSTYTYLLHKDYNFLREAYPDQSVTGPPRYYSFVDDTRFFVSPTPDMAYSTELHYYYKPEALEDAGENWLSLNGENALLYGALYHAYVYMKGDQDMVTHYKTQYQKAIEDLKLIAEGRNRKDAYRTPDRRMPT